MEVRARARAVPLHRREDALEGAEVVGRVARVEDGKDDHIEGARTLLELLPVDARDLVSRVPKRTAAKGAEHGVAYARVDERVQLCSDAPTRLIRVERAAVAQVDGRGAQLEERKDLVVREPGVSEVIRTARRVAGRAFRRDPLPRPSLPPPRLTHR